MIAMLGTNRLSRRGFLLPVVSSVRMEPALASAPVPNAVGTATSGKYRESPAKSVFSGIGPQRTLRDEPDFVELEGWITASGSFEQVLRLIDGIEQESWIKRIDQLKIDPADNGSLFDVTVRLTTLFVPGREPNEAGAVAATPSDFGRYAALLAANPFRLPPRAPPPPPPPDPQPMTDRPPTVVAFGYNQWVLTGTAFGPQGSEAWILNAQTRESRRLGAGEGIHDLILVSTNADTAEFRVGQEHFTIRVGQNLGDRTPAGQ